MHVTMGQGKIGLCLQLISYGTEGNEITYKANKLWDKGNEIMYIVNKLWDRRK